MKVPDYERDDPQNVEQLQTFLNEVAEATGVQSNANLRPLIERMSRQVEFITQALSHRLTVGDNSNSDVRTVAFEQLVPKRIKPTVSGAVKEVRIRQTFPKGPFLTPRALDWATTGPGEIQVVVWWLVAPTVPIDVEIVIEGD